MEKKEANDGKKGGKRKNTIALFFATRFSQLLISGREEPGRNKTSTPLSSRTHLSSLRIGTSLS